MATYTIRVNERSKTGKALVQFLKSTSEVVFEKKPNAETLKAMEELEQGKGEKIKDIRSFLNSI